MWVVVKTSVKWDRWRHIKPFWVLETVRSELWLSSLHAGNASQVFSISLFKCCSALFIPAGTSQAFLLPSLLSNIIKAFPSLTCGTPKLQVPRESFCG